MSSKVEDDPNIFQIIKEASAEKLLKLLKSIDGKKDLVLDKEIICSLDYIATFTQLKICDVEKVFKLEPGSSPGQTQRCVYLIRPTIENARIISDHINANLSVEKIKLYWVIYVPKKVFTSENIFEKEGVWEYITQMNFPLGFVTLEKNLASLEIENFYKSFFLKGDLKHIYSAALSLVQVCKICGPIPKVFGQGKCAKMVIELMSQLMGDDQPSQEYSDRISHLIVLDRDIDYVSVLLSQLTYEGLLDETFKINNGRVIFPKEVTGKEPMKVVLNSTDTVYGEIRDSFFASVFGFLGNKAKELQAKSQGTSTMSIGAMREFVTKEMKVIRQQQASLSLHIGACEFIMNQKQDNNFQERLQFERAIIENQSLKECISYIEDVINRQEPYTSALRLLCLLSIAQNGLMSSDYKSLATQFRQSYGSKYIITLHHLKKVGLLSELPPLLSTSSKKEKAVSVTKIAEKMATAVSFPRYSSFKAITKHFNLIPNEVDSANARAPKDMSYVFGGAYVPLIGRITEQVIVNDGFKYVEEGMKLLPGQTVLSFKANKESGYVKPVKNFKSKTILLYVLGGITHAEVAALRLLQKLHDCRIFIATTNFISGNSLMQTLSPSE